ncbi:hypothetical protein HK096_003254, partial [Nowakowskiella sp. JEL0078]
MDQHVKVELLDPKWREQRKRVLDKNRETNLVENANIVMGSLKRLAEYRTDIFGGDELEVDKRYDLQMRDEKMRAAQKEKDVWDGHTATIGSVAMKNNNAEEQIAHLQSLLAAQQHIIGPKVPENSQMHLLPPKPGVPILQPSSSSSFSEGFQPTVYQPQTAYQESTSAPMPWNTISQMPIPPPQQITPAAPFPSNQDEVDQSYSTKRLRVEDPPPLPGMLLESEFLQVHK